MLIFQSAFEHPTAIKVGAMIKNTKIVQINSNSTNTLLSSGVCVLAAKKLFKSREKKYPEFIFHGLMMLQDAPFIKMTGK